MENTKSVLILILAIIPFSMTLEKSFAIHEGTTTANISTPNQAPQTQENNAGSSTPPPPSEMFSAFQTNDTASSDVTAQGQWKTHSDRNFGVEFEYPPNWEIVVKTDRFETGPDLEVEEIDGLDSFAVSTAEDMSGDIIDAELFAIMGKNQAMEETDTRLIEGVEEHTPIGGGRCIFLHIH